MGFKQTLLFIMNMVRKTLQVELNNFYENLLKTDETISKQAYCEARQKIDPKAFIELNDQTAKLFYENFDDLKLWNGYRLSAVDGSVLEIPDTKLLRKTFGCSGNQNRMVARAKASCLFDVLNKIIIKSIIDRYPTPERESAKYLIDETIESGRKNDLILFDRRYPSAGFISYLHNCGIKFLIRSLKNHFSKVIEPGKEDQIVRISYNGATIRLRVVRILLPSGEVEILITNLLDKEYTINDLKELYFLRWGIEIKYDIIKNRLEVENFTGQTKVAIEQDFYATIYLTNIAELAKKQSDEQISKKNSNKNLKHEYQTNISVLIGSLKDKFILMMLESNTRKRHKLYKQLMKTISKSTVPIRPERSNKRIKRKVKGKYKTNHKRCL